MEGILIKLSKEIRETKRFFDTRFTDARARKLDKVDVTVSSRATQATVNDIKSRVIDIRSFWETSGWRIKESHASTRTLTNSPSGGKIVKASIEQRTAVGQHVITIATVSGSGILRFVKDYGVIDGRNLNCKINIDGKIIDLGETSYCEYFFAAGGIRFKSYFKIIGSYEYRGGHWEPYHVYVKYGYTLGD